MIRLARFSNKIGEFQAVLTGGYGLGDQRVRDELGL